MSWTWSCALNRDCTATDGKLCTIQPLPGVAGKVPEKLGNLTCGDRIGSLHFTGTGINELPESIGMLKRLRHLYITSLALTHVPESIGRLTALKTFIADHSDLISVPKTIGGLTSLNYLDLGHTHITDIPDTISALRSLGSLDVSFTLITSLPDAVSALTSLRVLNVASTSMTGIPDAVGDLSLDTLNVSDSGLTSFPEAIRRLSGLKHLYLSNNRISEIPTWINELPLLQTLSLSHNQLNDSDSHSSLGLPSAGFAYMRELDISYNQLTRLPISFETFVKNTASPFWNLKLNINFITGSMCRRGNVCPIASLDYRLLPQLCKAGHIRQGRALINPGVGGNFGDCVPRPVPSFEVRQAKDELDIVITKKAKNASLDIVLVVSAANTNGTQWLEEGIALPKLAMGCGTASSCSTACSVIWVRPLQPPKVVCVDRNDTSVFGTTCAESRLYCGKRGLNLRIFF